MTNKLISKCRTGAKVKKLFHSPKTPCDRLLDDARVDPKTKEQLNISLNDFDPLVLLHEIRQTQIALVALVGAGDLSTEQRSSLEEFLSALPRLWENDDARPTHKPKPIRERNYRTRLDPFEGEWQEILGWLEQEPDVTATTLLERLKELHSSKYDDKHLRTLQRRIGQWRYIMAKQLVTGTTLE